MYEFVADQVLGINGLVNFSNIVFLAAYSVRDVLILRILSIVGEGLILPYYYFQDEKLWPPIFWGGGAFMIVNAIRIVAMALERRPVTLSDKEEQLYRVAFSSIERREFLRLVSLARWVDCSPGEVILEKGQHISDAIVVMSGDLEAILSSNTRMAIRPGQLIGDVSAYSGLASPVDVVARGPGTLAKWDLRHMREFTASRPELRASLLRDCEHGSCRQIARCRDRRFRSRCGKIRVEAIPERRIAARNLPMVTPKTDRPVLHEKLNIRESHGTSEISRDLQFGLQRVEWRTLVTGYPA